MLEKNWNKLVVCKFYVTIHRWKAFNKDRFAIEYNHETDSNEKALY